MVETRSRGIGEDNHRLGGANRIRVGNNRTRRALLRSAAAKPRRRVSGADATDGSRASVRRRTGRVECDTGRASLTDGDLSLAAGSGGLVSYFH